ncbi:hypothetical protein CDD82_6099 [Ophiocordyceps australis]|uniref:Uncharacterized protein n=1 Tax=Ophiocordyceps australis TaxID=1399860 RepID=A0A2C5ZST1_9HYPO|nr:hypothetical protein CDD82_6099 [Ophiocordyceps australis]
MASWLFILGTGAIVTNALVVRNTKCPLHLTVDGAVSGSVGQISSGQVRAGQAINSAVFMLDDGGLTDSNSRGSPSYVLQCDQGQTPDGGFSIGCDGGVAYKGQPAFYECRTEKDGQYNIYLEPKGADCAKVTLGSDGCHSQCPDAPAQPQPQPQPQPPKACPASLEGPYEYPHMIAHLDKSHPDTYSGSSYFGLVSHSISSIFNFDLPAGDEGKRCSLVFLLPRNEELQTSSFSLSGDGRLGFSRLKSPATEHTTFNSKPAQQDDLGVIVAVPGNSYTIATFDCPADQRVGFEVSAVGGTYLKYFQDYNPSAIGLYITKC